MQNEFYIEFGFSIAIQLNEVMFQILFLTQLDLLTQKFANYLPFILKYCTYIKFTELLMINTLAIFSILFIVWQNCTLFKG